MIDPITVGIILVLIISQVCLVWAIFNMRNHLEKQTTLFVASIRLLSKIANNTGSDKEEVNKLLKELGGKL